MLLGCIRVIRNSRHEGWIIGYFIITSVFYHMVLPIYNKFNGLLTNVENTLIHFFSTHTLLYLLKLIKNY